MVDHPGQLDWPPVVAGDYMDPFQITVRDRATHAPIAITRAAMQVRRADGALVLDWATDLPATAPGYGCMVLLSGPNGQVQVGPAVLAIEPGVYFHDLQFTLADGGRVKTWAAGTLTVLPQSTR